MSCLSGFKLYSRWVPLLLVSGCIYSFETIKKKRLGQISLPYSESELTYFENLTAD